MGTLPVDAPATRALAEVIAPFQGSGRDAASDFGFGDSAERLVADHAAGERAKGAGQIEASYDFFGLAPAVSLA